MARESQAGPDHPDTLSVRNNLAEAYGAAGNAAEAIRLHEETFRIREAKLGPGHPDTIGTRDNLLNLYYSNGRFADAVPLLEQAEAARVRAAVATTPGIRSGSTTSPRPTGSSVASPTPFACTRGHSRLWRRRSAPTTGARPRPAQPGLDVRGRGAMGRVRAAEAQSWPGIARRRGRAASRSPPISPTSDSRSSGSRSGRMPSPCSANAWRFGKTACPATGGGTTR